MSYRLHTSPVIPSAASPVIPSVASHVIPSVAEESKAAAGKAPLNPLHIRAIVHLTRDWPRDPKVPSTLMGEG